MQHQCKKCNTGANYTYIWIMICWKTMGNFLSQWYQVKRWQKRCKETLKKVFSNAKKMASRKIFRHFLYAIFFMFILLRSNHTLILVQFEIYFHLWVLQKVKLHSPRRLVQFQLLENSLVQINSKLNSKTVWLPFSHITFQLNDWGGKQVFRLLVKLRVALKDSYFKLLQNLYQKYISLLS